VKVTAKIRDVRSKFDERGGTCNAWLETAADGPGMQVRWNDNQTDFFSDNPFARADESDDSIFYNKPRFVQHLDETAIGNVTFIYGEVLKPGMKVLDLMSSWTSHFPEDIELDTLTGLGMNAEELAANPRLSDYLTLDLNKTDRLPFDDAAFDAITCTASVEYLNRPFEIFREAARVLKPGGVFAVTFSNRWFPPKAIAIWSRLHEFERLGLVTEYFLESSMFEKISTHSIRGLPRPDGDKYAKQFAYSDPIYAVIGQRR
jgi:SAM-dependent methyltransferase